MKKSDDFLYDVRIASRNIREGLVSKKDYEKHLKQLPNSEDKGEVLVFDEDIVEELAEVTEETEEVAE